MFRNPQMRSCIGPGEIGMLAMIEKRACPRHRVLKRGTLAFNGGGGVDCMVRNISADGARLDIDSPAGLPRAFTLVIETDHFMRRCRPIWFDDRKLGVSFDQD